MPREKLSKESRKNEPHQGSAGWRLAPRGPIRTYDNYAGGTVELQVGQRNPNSIEGLLIDFRYVSVDGERSRRSVLCWQCGRNGKHLYIRGYCAFREELRTFRIDRMSDLIAIQGQHDRTVEDIDGFFAAFAARETHEMAPASLLTSD